MQYSNTTTKIGILQQIEKLTGLGDAGITGDATYLLQFTGDVNNAYSRVAYLIMKSDGSMQFDDPSHGDTPISDFNLVSGQQNYGIFGAVNSALKDWLEIERVEILDNNDNGVLLTSIDHKNITEAMSEYKSTAGTPAEFDLNGTDIYLYPKPNYNKTSGGTVYFKRAPSYFVSTDTTKVPGFSTLFHELLVLWPVYWWGVAKGLSNVNQVRAEITVMEKGLAEAYGRRAGYKKPRMVAGYHSNK